MSGQEIAVAVEEKLPVIFVILNDGALGMVKHGQRLACAEPIGYQLPEVDYAALAWAMGAEGYTIRLPKDLRVLDVQALCKRAGPSLLDVHIDVEEVPPIKTRVRALSAVKMSAKAPISKEPEVIHSRLWQKLEEPDNPFAAKACYCAGYDVYGDLLGKATWIEYLYLLFKHEGPSCSQTKLLEALAIAVANLGPREPSINAAMSAGAGGSTHASCLMAALAVGAGQLGGAHEVALAMAYWRECGENAPAWRDRLRDPPKEERADVWIPMEHAPGFDPHGASCATPVRQTLASLARLSPGRSLPWLRRNAATNACSVDPTAMLLAAVAAVVDNMLSDRKKSTLTRNEPNQIPAQARDPSRSMAVIAIPEGGHTTVTLPGGIATKNPS